MECERKAEMTDEERVREMVKHTVANVVESLGQALLETREAEPDRPLLGQMIREAEGHLLVARVIELKQGMSEDDLRAENARLREENEHFRRFDVKIALPSDYDAELDHPLSVAADIAKRMEANEPGSIAVICTLSEVQVLLHQNARLREEVAALKRNRLAAFKQKECADVATVLGDYLQQTDQEKAFLEEWRAECRRREGNNG